MGVYNNISTEQPCLNCHASVEWQSKHLEYDGFLLANVMQVIELRPTMNGEMHAHCEACHTWIDATIRQGQVVELKTSPLPSRRHTKGTQGDGKKTQDMGL